MQTARSLSWLVALWLVAPQTSTAQTPPGSVETVRADRHVIVTETIVQGLVAGPDRFALVSIRCRDVVPRGGSDCFDRGYFFNRVELRAYARATDTLRWRRQVALSSYPPPTMTVGAGRITLALGRLRWTFAILDGSPEVQLRTGS